MHIVHALLACGVGVGLGLLVDCDAQAQRVPCWFVPNGVNQTLVCANGFWQTTTPEGDIITGNGPSDPNAAMNGAGLITDPGTGNINMRGPSIRPATPQPSAADPGAGAYGIQPRMDN